ncbi:MAG: PAS domain S-box protein [Syntrophaceae bacterium]|nr:PAS domain S-box protein [Syntrophaceae bacterium]
MSIRELDLRTILENMIDVVVILDLNGVFRSVSPSVRCMLGYAPADMIGTVSFDYLFPDDRERVAWTFLRTLESERQMEWFRFRHADGRFIWLETVARAVRDGNRLRGIVVSARDVSDRMRMEEALHERERRYRMIVENANDAIYLHDFEGNIIDVNDNACRMLDYRREELVGANLGKIDPKWRLPENPELANLLTHERHTFERENVRRDGSVVPVEVSVKIVGWEGSGLVMGFVRDITERKTAEAQLRRSEKQYRLLVENTMDYVVRFHLDGTVLFVSEAIETNLGYLPQEVVGRSYLDFVHPDDRPSAGRVFRLASKEGQQGSMECRLRRKDGRYRWMEIRGKSFRNDVTNRLEIISVARDVTRRVEMEQALRRAEKGYRDIFDNALVAIYRSTPEGRVVMANEASARILGYESADDMVHSDTDVAEQIYVDGTDRQWIIDRLETKDSCVVEIPYRRKNGEITWSMHYIRAIRDEAGGLLCFEGVAQDITEQKKAEENLRTTLNNLEGLVQERTEELEDVNTALRVLLNRSKEDRRILEERLQRNVNELLMPTMNELRTCGLNEKGLLFLDLLQSNLREITSPFLSNLSSFYKNLTPREIQVAGMIREGKRTKEIAELLGVSTVTVDTHRINIRTKLGLIGEKVNLRSHLLSMA